MLLSGTLAQSTTPSFALNQYSVRKAEEPRTTQATTELVSFPSPTGATNLPKFRVLCDSALSEDMRSFIECFKNKRMTLGYTQEDVGNELSRTNGPTYSQSFISRFESKQLGLKASERMRPILQAWLDAKDIDNTTGVRICKKRRRRTSFTSDALAVLVENFEKNPKPSATEIAQIAAQINIEPVTVKVWFCNRKQMVKRRSMGKVKVDNTVKSALEARTKLKEQDSNDAVATVDTGDQYAEYSIERLQPLVTDDTVHTAAAAATVVSTEETVQTSPSPYHAPAETVVEAIETTTATVPPHYQTTSDVTTNGADDEADAATMVSPLNSSNRSFDPEC